MPLMLPLSAVMLPLSAGRGDGHPLFDVLGNSIAISHVYDVSLQSCHWFALPITFQDTFLRLREWEDL